ncbi:type IV secretion system DNA-binding domain-containing protein [Vibrio vulnificus]|uniref:type IV secretion system DNA-binding domain-containing protein n=1 Tax=Vibrio vulnificus TaxID=672 RepID=UPI0032EE90F8
MERDQNSALTDPFIKGGQVTKNSIVMFWQNVKMIILPTLMVYTFISIVIFFLSTNAYERYLWMKFNHAEVHLESMGDKTPLEFVYPDGEHAKVKASDIVNSPQVMNSYRRVSWLIDVLFISVTILSFATFYAARRFLRAKGEKLSERKVIDGMRPFKDINQLKELITKENQKVNYISKYSLLDVPFYDGSELFHISVAGAPGQGKTQVLLPLVQQIKDNNDKAIVYDKARAFVKYFYDPEKDIILNPLDSRSLPWNIHAEVRDAIGYDAIFEAMIPMAPNVEPYWTLAARTIASKTALRFRQAQEYRMAPMLERLYNTSLDEIAAMLKGTEAGALIDCENPKTGESLRSVMSTYIKGLGYCYDAPVYDPITGKQDLNRLFSITKWIQDDSKKGMVFITSKGDQEATLKPLITTFFNIAVTAGMSMEADLTRRVFILLDELPALNKLPAIQRAAAELRQFGFVVVGGWQLYSMLESVYGATEAESIAGIFNTIVQFNAGKEPENVKKAAAQFGTYTVRVPKDSLSIGVGPYRDGANFNFDDETYDCVTEADIRMLPKLHGYIAMAGGSFPVTKFIKDVYVPEVIAESMVERPLEELSLGHYLIIGDEKLDLEQFVKDSLDSQKDSGKSTQKGKTKESTKPKPQLRLVKNDEEESDDAERPQNEMPHEVVRQLGVSTDPNLVNESPLAPPMKDGVFDVEEAERLYAQKSQTDKGSRSKDSDIDYDLFT